MRSTICLVNFHRQKGQPLTNVVMQISCDPAALLFLGFDQLATHFFKRLLGKLLIGGVNRRADKSSKRSITIHSWGRNVEHPTVDSIAPTQTVLLREWLFALQRLIEGI